MAVDFTGALGQPQFDETKPSNLAADLNAVSNWAAAFGTDTDYSGSIAYKNSCYSDDPARMYAGQIGYFASLILNLRWSSAIAVNTQLMILPDACKPRFALHFPVWFYNGGAWTGPGLFIIDATGGVYPNVIPAGGGAAGGGAYGTIHYRRG